MKTPQTSAAPAPINGRQRMALAISRGLALTAISFGAPVHPTLLSVRTRGGVR